MKNLFDNNYSKEIENAFNNMEEVKQNELQKVKDDFKKLREEYATLWAEKDFYEQLVINGHEEYQVLLESTKNKYNELSNQIINEKDNANKEINRLENEIKVIKNLCMSYAK